MPDEALLERRASGESLRQLAADYEVAHTTLLHYFRRPDVVLELREARRRMQAERRRLAAQRAEERRQERDVRRRAREGAKRDRQLDAWTPPDRSHRSDSDYLGWLDGRDAPRGLPSRERYNANDDKAAEVVASGGGVEQVIEATGLRSRENVFRLHPQIMSRALKNDAHRSAAGGLNGSGLRRLVPDADLLRRRAAGEPLRRLAPDYDVAHTTLSHYFRRPQVAKALRSVERVDSRGHRSRRDRVMPLHDEALLLSKLSAEVREEIREIVCPLHGHSPTIRSEPAPAGETRFEVKFCCERAKQEFLTDAQVGRLASNVDFD